MTIKANGALARYLGICVWEKYYPTGYHAFKEKTYPIIRYEE